MQGVLNIHALIEGHTRFETKKVRLKQTINMCFIKNIHILKIALLILQQEGHYHGII